MDGQRRRLILAGLLALAGGVRPAVAIDPVPLRLGIMPIYGIRSLVRRYEPMRSYIARRLSQPVRVETAADFRKYLASMLAGEFDIAVAAAHFARIAQLDAGWLPLIQFTPGHDATLVAPAGPRAPYLASLVGRELAVIDRLAITVMGALAYLDRQGLQAGRDFRVVEHRNHASVVHALLSGSCAMAVTTSQGLHQIPGDQRERLAVVHTLPEIPAFVVLAAPTLGQATTARLRTAMSDFAGTAEGLEFLAQSSYTGTRVADDRAMRQADPYLSATRRMMGLG